MKNARIEALIKKAREMGEQFGNDSKEMKEFNEANKRAWRWTRSYLNAVEKGFDEIVINECVFEGEVKEMLEAAKELKIEYFVFASGFSGAFEVINEMVKNGARVGKFVVKTYEEERFGDLKQIEVPGMRINL